VWRNEAWQDVQKPGKIQFVPPNTGTSEGVDRQSGERKFPDPRKPYIKNGKTIGSILPNGKMYPMSKSDTVGDDGLIYHFQDPRAHGQNKNSEQVKEHYFIYEVKYGHPPGAGYFGDQWIQQGQAMQNQQAQAQKPQENPWTGPAHGSSSEELAMFKAGKKPVSIQRVEDPAWKELVSSGKYPTEIIYQNGKPSSVVIGQPGNEDSVYKVHKLVQTATKYGEAGDFSPYQNPKYHKLVGQLLGYSDSQINSFMSHYFRNKTTEGKTRPAAGVVPQPKDKKVAETNDPSGQIAIHNQGLEIPIASKYVGDGQFKITVKNKPAIVTVAGFEIDPVEPGKLDSFYLTDVATGKTHHVTNGWNDPVAVAIFNNLGTNQRPALKEIYKQDMAFYNEHEWDGSRPDRLQGLALSGYDAIPADSFVKSHQDMKKVTGSGLAENTVDSKTWMAEIKAKYPTVKFMQAKMPGAPIRAYVDNKVVAEFNFDKPQGVAESALKDKADLDAKRKALQDLSMNKDVDQQAVQQRKLDLDKEAKAKGLDEGWSDAMVARRTGTPRTPYSVYINGKKWKDFENDDHARAVMDKLKAKFKADGRDPSVITIAPTDIPEGAAEEQKPAGWGEFPPKQEITIVPPKKLKSGQTYQDQNKYWQSQGQAPIYKTNEEKEPTTRQELLNRVDKIQRMMSQERNPANLQILRKELEMLKQRYQHLKEDSDSEAVEIAIIKRILIAHTDLIMEFGLDKVTQAIEEVAYNVGDVDEIGTSDVSAYVQQVKQILGADA
jgi:hypothetical protein